jgi:hypothetical protein
MADVAPFLFIVFHFFERETIRERDVAAHVVLGISPPGRKRRQSSGSTGEEANILLLTCCYQQGATAYSRSRVPAGSDMSVDTI